MRRSLARFSGPVSLVHAPSLADSITTTPEFRFSVHTGSIGYALIYPIAVPAVCFVLALFLMPETRKISIWQPIEPRTAS